MYVIMDKYQDYKEIGALATCFVYDKWDERGFMSSGFEMSDDKYDFPRGVMFRDDKFIVVCYRDIEPVEREYWHSIPVDEGSFCAEHRIAFNGYENGDFHVIIETQKALFNIYNKSQLNAIVKRLSEKYTVAENTDNGRLLINFSLKYKNLINSPEMVYQIILEQVKYFTTALESLNSSTMELSETTFNRAVELKRQGRYSAAINIYHKEMGKMFSSGDLHEFTTYARALAKCLYLNRQPKKALECYHAIVLFNMIAIPQFLKDMKDNPERIKEWIIDWAPEVGYVVNYSKTGSINSSYFKAISGAGGTYDRGLYFEEGWKFIVNIFDEGPNVNKFWSCISSLE